MELLIACLVFAFVYAYGQRQDRRAARPNAEALREMEAIRSELQRVATQIDTMIGEREERLAELARERTERRRATARSLLGRKSRPVKRNITLH